MDNKSIESFRSPCENNHEWSLRRKFLENNSDKFPVDRLVCLSMCYINNVSYGVTYPPGVMSQLKELSQGLPSHMDIVKDKNKIAFVKSAEKPNNCKYGNFVKSNDASNNDNNVNTTKSTMSKYSNFVHSSEASYEKTYQSGAGLGFGGTGGAGLGFGSTGGAGLGFGAPAGAGLGFGTSGSTEDSTIPNSAKYPGFVQSGSTGSANSRSCFSESTETVTDMRNYPGFVKSGSTVNETSKSCFSTTDNVSDMLNYSAGLKSGSAAENANTSSNRNNRYLNMLKSSPNSYVGSQTDINSNKYRSKPVLRAPQESPRPNISSPPPAKRALISNPSSTASTNSMSFLQESGKASSSESMYLKKKFYALSDILIKTKSPVSMNAIQILNLALTKVTMILNINILPAIPQPGTIFKCKVRLADVLVGEGSATTKKAAKHEAFSKALDLLTRPSFKIEDQNGQPVLVSSDQPAPQLNKTTPPQYAGTPAAPKLVRKKPMSSWGHFLVMENKMVNNALAVVRHSADFNKMSSEYICTPDPQGISCQLLINEEPIVECVAENKVAAKLQTAEKAIAWLKERCWTIVIKQSADSDIIDVSRDKIMGEIEKQCKPIGSDNIGNQLLRKMGWEGGGIGAEGNEGIAEPITVNQVIDRQGLGCRESSGVSTKFDVQIRDVLLRYVKSKKQEDLVFTSEFNKEERAIIHKEARRYNLKSMSRGGGESRHLIISRKRSAGQLFNHILSSGGSTQKYELIPPLNKT